MKLSEMGFGAIVKIVTAPQGQKEMEGREYFVSYPYPCCLLTPWGRKRRRPVLAESIKSDDALRLEVTVLAW